MTTQVLLPKDDIRSLFSRALSDMYRAEVPQYGTLVDLVADVNARVLAEKPEMRDALNEGGEIERLAVERHGAIRVGTERELSDMRRAFAVLGMWAVGYYDLSVAGVPVHSTAFRPIDEESLRRNPFRVFTSLLRLELIEDAQLRAKVAETLARRTIFTPLALDLISTFERQGGLTQQQAEVFVAELVKTFRWHSEATVDSDTYAQLHDAHRLIADVVCFKGPHINHLTPRTLDIDQVQAEMPKRGITPKDVIEGPPTRRVAILLRQTSFKALSETIAFPNSGAATEVKGRHTARFGEIEQRGVALTRKGRDLYDLLLANVREMGGTGNSGPNYGERLAAAFQDFPDDYDTLRREGLAFFRYRLTDAGKAAAAKGQAFAGMDELLEAGLARADALIYEDFLPVSAAGIFQSNLGGAEQTSYSANAAQACFEASLGAKVIDEFDLYEKSQATSIEAIKQAFREKVTA